MSGRTGRAGAALLWIVLGASRAWAQGPVEIRGLFEVTAANRGEGLYTNVYNHGDSNFDPYRLHVFFGGDVAAGFRALAQVSFDEVSGVTADGAYLLWTPVPGRDLHVEAGKVPWPVGTWAPRTYSDKNPLIGLPLMYQYHTTLRVEAVPPSADALLAAAGTGQSGPDYGTGPGWKGMPVVYDRCWDFGVILTGSQRPWEFAIGATNGTTGAGVAGPDWNDGKSVVGRLGLTPSPVVRVGFSGAYGPYLPDWLQPALPPGSDVDAFHQKLAMADLALSYGHVELRAEAHLNTWETPSVGDLDVRGGYVEGKATVMPSLYVAARYEIMRFGKLAGATIAERPWDNDRDRLEAGAGYRLARRGTLKAVYQSNVEYSPGAGTRRESLVALGLSLGF